MIIKTSRSHFVELEKYKKLIEFEKKLDYYLVYML